MRGGPLDGLKPIFFIIAHTASSRLLLPEPATEDAVDPGCICSSVGPWLMALIGLGSLPRWKRISLTVARMWFLKSLKDSSGLLVALHIKFSRSS